MTVIKVACAIIKQGNKTLCLQRSSKMSLPLKWEFPGGKLEDNETPEECLKREILEELKIEIKIIKQLTRNKHQYESNKVVMLIPFVCEIVKGQIVLTEHESFKWLKGNKLKTLDWAAADVPILEEYLKFDKDATRTI